MDWKRVYDLIIEKVKLEHRSGANMMFISHHILPRSLQGSDDKSNLVLLTEREHLFCHKLLVKIYPGPSMWNALFMMASMKYGKYLTSREYQRIKEEYRKTKSERAKAEGKWKGVNNPQYGKPISEQRKQRYRDLMGFGIKCIETGELFISQKDASIKTGIQRTSIVKCLQGIFKTAGGFHWEYIDPNRPNQRNKWNVTKREQFQLKQGIKLQCIETGEIFSSRTEASINLKISYNDIRYNKNSKYHFEEIK